MKHLSLLIVFIATFSLQINAQNAIPNPGFENWDAQSCPEPISWGTINSSLCLIGSPTVTEATGGNAYSGTSAIKMESIYIFFAGEVAPGIAATGTVNTNTQAVDGGVAYNLRPDSLVGWYKYAPSGTDTGSVEVTFSKWNSGTNQRDVVGSAQFTETSAVSSYTRFSEAITYASGDTPDTMVVILNSSLSDPQDGSIFYVDDLDLIQPPSSLAATTDSTDNLCFASCDGSASVVVTGGTTPYTYLWDDPSSQATATATGLCAGTYTILVTDAAAATWTDVVVIAEPSLLTLGGSMDPDTCGLGVGGAYVVASGGTTPYIYLWDDPGTSSTSSIAGVTAGTYNVSITDANNCNVVSQLIVTDSPAIVISTINNTDPSSCGATDGDATVIFSGGTGTTTYLWDDASAQTTATANGLGAGTYTVVLTGSFRCTDNASVTLNDPGSPTLSITSSSNVSCFGGTDGEAVVGVTGGTSPITYLWSTGTNPSDSDVVSLPAGIATVTVTDAGGCSGTISVTITEPSAALSIDAITATDLDCNGDGDGAVDITVSGGTTGYSYLWSPGSEVTQNLTGLSGGTYSVLVTDQNSCMDSTSVTVTEPTSALSTSITSTDDSGAGDGTATVSGSGGTTPYTYSWNDPFTQSTPIAIDLIANSYTATVFDANGCMDTISVVVGGVNGIDVAPSHVEISLYPNPAVHAFNLLINSKQANDLTLRIYDSVGRMVKAANIDNGLNRISTIDLSDGIYSYRLIVGSETVIGKVAIAR